MRSRFWSLLFLSAIATFLVILLQIRYSAVRAARSTRSGMMQPLPASQRAAVEASTRSFMQSVANDVTTQGPTVWEKHFVDDPAFFMANDGRLVFPNTQTAAQGIEAFAHTIKHIELHWGDDLRVDVLTPNLALVGSSWSEVQIDNADHQVNEGGFFTGLVENRDGRWQFRDAHWSSIPAPAPVPKKP